MESRIHWHASGLHLLMKVFKSEMSSVYIIFSCYTLPHMQGEITTLLKRSQNATILSFTPPSTSRSMPQFVYTWWLLTMYIILEALSLEP